MVKVTGQRWLRIKSMIDIKSLIVHNMSVRLGTPRLLCSSAAQRVDVAAMTLAPHPWRTSTATYNDVLLSEVLSSPPLHVERLGHYTLNMWRACDENRSSTACTAGIDDTRTSSRRSVAISALLFSAFPREEIRSRNVHPSDNLSDAHRWGRRSENDRLPSDGELLQLWWDETPLLRDVTAIWKEP
jgi:hypothetical protein